MYLGFGVFALSASLVFETGGRSASGEQLLFERRSLGYLSPAELALLLAAQLTVRGDREEQAAVLEAPSLNHRHLVERGLKDAQPNPARANAIAFRLKSNRAPLLLWLGLATGGAIGLSLTADALPFWGLCVLGAALGYTGGAALTNDECSACERRLPRNERRCQSCGAAIVGELKSREEQLDAEERYCDRLRGLHGRRRSAMAHIQKRAGRGVRRR